VIIICATLLYYGSLHSMNNGLSWDNSISWYPEIAAHFR
jgi:hypothetical protein